MTLPRRLPPNPQRRLNTALADHAALSGQGQTRAARPVRQGGNQGRVGGFGFAVVEHGDDPDAARPIADLVYWIGTAQPNNATVYDLWYTADNP